MKVARVFFCSFLFIFSLIYSFIFEKHRFLLVKLINVITFDVVLVSTRVIYLYMLGDIANVEVYVMLDWYYCYKYCYGISATRDVTPPPSDDES